MTVDPKGGTATQPGGETSAPGTAAGQGANTENDPEKLRAEVARLQAAQQQSLAEKSTLEQTKRDLEAAQQRLAELEAGGTPPTAPARSANPFEILSTEIGQYREHLARNPDDLAVRRLLAQAENDYRGYQWQMILQREKPKLDTAPEAYRAKAIELFGTGRFASAEDAILAARGGALSDDDIAKAKQATADAAAAAAAKDKPSTSTTSASEPAAGIRKMTGSEYTAFLEKHEGKPEAHKLIADVDGSEFKSPTVVVDWSR